MKVHQVTMLLGILALAAVCVSACSDSEPEYGTDGLCRYGWGASPFKSELLEYGSNRTIQWTPDGSQILFDYSAVILDRPFLGEGPKVGDLALTGNPLWGLRPGVPDIYAVNVSDLTVTKVLDISSRHPEHTTWGDTTVFDLSPDGSRIAYTACALSEETVQVDGSEKQVYNSEVFVSSIDGSNVVRLTNNTYLDTLPVWSPDGERLAFVSDPDRSLPGVQSAGRPGIRVTTRLTVHEVATGASREVGIPSREVGFPKRYAAAPYRLEWSPGGDRIAFVMLEREKYPWDLAVYTVGADGSGLTRVSDARSGPAWSPDGEEIALVLHESGYGWVLNVFAADGSNLVKERIVIDRFRGSIGTRLGRGLFMGNLSWSPDGSKILLERLAGPDSVVELGTAGFELVEPRASDSQSGAIPSGAGTGGSVLSSPLPLSIGSYRNNAWSPDGSQLAVRTDSITSFKLGLAKPRVGDAEGLLSWLRDLE